MLFIGRCATWGVARTGTVVPMVVKNEGQNGCANVAQHHLRAVPVQAVGAYAHVAKQICK